MNITKQYIKKYKGFTLIELIVTVLIIGIIFAAGIPGLNSLLGNVSQSATAEKLLNSLSYARGEAVARLEDVSLEVAPAAAGFAWNVFVDSNGDCVEDGGEELLRRVNVSADAVTIGVGCVGFNALGESNRGVSSLSVSSASATGSAASVTISATGFAKIN